MLSLPIRWVSSLLRRGLWATVILVLVGLWALAVAFVSVYKDRLISSSTRELVQINGIVSQHAQALFRAVETDLKVVDHWLQAYKGRDPLNDPHFVALISELKTVSGGLIDLRMISADGKLYYIPNPDHQPLANVSDRGYYRAHLGAGPRKMYIGDAVLSRVTGKWGIPISWRLQSQVAGLNVVFAALEHDRLIALHEQWRFKGRGSILLVREDGKLLSRAPFEAKYIGLDMNADAPYRNLLASGDETALSDSALTDGVTRIVSLKRVDGVPLSVVVTRGLDEVLVDYYVMRRVVFGCVALLTLVVLVFTGLVHRAQKSLLNTQNDLQRLAMVDDLTQVMNRRAFFAQAEREFSRARRQNEEFAVLMLDIDYFKQINDQSGHGEGDRVLSECAKLWSHMLRGQDLIGRLGGEEFCVLLPKTGEQASIEVAERLCRETERQMLTGDHDNRPVTVSVGVAWLMAPDENWKSLLARADQALYRAKHGGRNRIEVQPSF